MRKGDIVNVVAQAVGRAAEVRGWSLRRLAQEVGLTGETMSRWKSGESRSMDIEALAKVFELAGLSMDASFGLPPLPAPTDEAQAQIDAKLDLILNRLEQMRLEAKIAGPKDEWKPGHPAIDAARAVLEQEAADLEREHAPKRTSRKRA